MSRLGASAFTDRVETIGFDYGQRHAIELTQRPIVRAAIASLDSAWAARLGEDIVVDLSGYGALAESAFDRRTAPLRWPRADWPTTLRARRAIWCFSRSPAAHAYRRGIGVLIGGMCEADYSGYPDCRRGKPSTPCKAR